MSGYEEVSAITAPPKLSQKVYELINKEVANDWNVKRLAEHLFISESTLRRKLKVEGTSVKAIRNRTRLGYGPHLIQTTVEEIGSIAMRCG